MDRETHGSRSTHNQPSANAARSHAHSGANLCPKVARELTSVPGSIPLFWEPNLFITVEGEQRRPYFFRVADLETLTLTLTQTLTLTLTLTLTR